MLKITTQDSADTAAITLEGKLADAWVDELEHTWYSVRLTHRPENILLDLCNVSFIDAEAKKLLRWMCGEGASFKTRGCVAGGVVQDIKQECSQSRRPS